PVRVDDQYLHTVKLTRRGREGSLQLDNYPAVTGTSQGVLQVLNTPGNVYLGGVPDLESYTGGKFSKNFKGCVMRLELNGVAVNIPAHALFGVNVNVCTTS
ncbi:hypothetical protein EGW08_004893, partial [Elysia chlorotica]